MTDANHFALDPAIAAMCDEACIWLGCVAGAAMMRGLTIPQGIEALRPRVHTGYMPAAQRSAVAHRAYRDGLRTPPKRPTADDRARSEAQAWGLAR
jgi:hypothetical protein